LIIAVPGGQAADFGAQTPCGPISCPAGQGLPQTPLITADPGGQAPVTGAQIPCDPIS